MNMSAMTQLRDWISLNREWLKSDKPAFSVVLKRIEREACVVVDSSQLRYALTLEAAMYTPNRVRPPRSTGPDRMPRLYPSGVAVNALQKLVRAQGTLLRALTRTVLKDS